MSTSQLGLGPVVDHTYGNQYGHYLFIDNSRKEGEEVKFNHY